MIRFLAIAGVLAALFAGSGCTPCGEWSKFNGFTNACHSSGAVK